MPEKMFEWISASDVRDVFNTQHFLDYIAACSTVRPRTVLLVNLYHHTTCFLLQFGEGTKENCRVDVPSFINILNEFGKQMFFTMRVVLDGVHIGNINELVLGT